MFKLATTPTYFWSVTLGLPNDDDRVDTAKFDIQFKRVSQDEFDEMHDRVHALKEPLLNPRDFVRSVVVGWRGVHDGDGTELPFTAGALEKLLNVNGAAMAIAKAFFASVHKAAEKN